MWAESSPSNFLTEKSFYNICHQMIISRWRWTRRRRSLARPPASRSRCGWSGHSTTPASTSSTRRRTRTGDPGNLLDRWATIELARRVMDSYYWKHPTSNSISMLGFWCICWQLKKTYLYWLLTIEWMNEWLNEMVMSYCPEAFHNFWHFYIPMKSVVISGNGVCEGIARMELKAAEMYQCSGK